MSGVPTFVRPVVPDSTPAAKGELGLVANVLSYHDGTGVVGLGGAQNPIVSAEFDVTAVLTGGQAARSGRFTIADASFQAGQELYIQQSGQAISTKGTRNDENEMDHLIPRGVVTSNGQATVYWSSNTFVKGIFRFNYRSS